MAASTSRAVGKLVAKLVITAGCLPVKSVPRQLPPPPQRQPPDSQSISQRKLSATDKYVPLSRRNEVSLGKSKVERVQAQDKTTLEAIQVPATVEPSALSGSISDKMWRTGDKRGTEGVALTESMNASRSDDGGEPGPTRCREKSSGPLRGGDLM